MRNGASKMKLETLTFTDIMFVIAIMVLAITTYNTFMSGIKNMREEKKRRDAPVDMLAEKVDANAEKLAAHDKMLKNDKQRLDETETELRILLRSQMALLSHEVNGNSNDKLQASMAEINEYLVNK